MESPVDTDPPPRTPLFRGAGGMPLLRPFIHTPDPFQKGRADAVGLFLLDAGLTRLLSFIWIYCCGVSC